jgi:hypothetical protein
VEVAVGTERRAPTHQEIERKLIRGGIVVAVLVAIEIGIIALLPGLDGMRSAIAGASPGWVLAAAGIQLLGTALGHLRGL